MISIDNGLGIGASMGEGVKGERYENEIHLNDNKVYGESPIPDCPPNSG